MKWTPDTNVSVLLLKSPAPDKDGYEAWFDSETLIENVQARAQFVPVLGHHLIPDALKELREIFLNPGPYFYQVGQNGKWGAFVFTSQRAVEGFRAVMNDLDSSNIQPELDYYVVGPETHKVLAATRGVDEKRIKGRDCGTSAELAVLIQKIHNEAYQPSIGDSREDSLSHGEPVSSKPGILFVTGAKHKDDLRRILDLKAPDEHTRIRVDELIVYETKEVSSFADDIRLAIDEALSQNASRKMVWFVVFSPSGCETLLRALGWLDESVKVKGNLKDDDRWAYLATIGPTTAEFLRKKYGCEPDVVAAKPSAEGIGEGIREFLRKSQP